MSEYAGIKNASISITKEDALNRFLTKFIEIQFFPLKKKTTENQSFNPLFNRFQNHLNLSLTRNVSGIDLERLLADCNEVVVGNWLFDIFSGSSPQIDYEPELPNRKSIDYRVRSKDGREIYFDVKTIHPQNIDDSGKYDQAKEAGHISKNHHIFSDGGFYHNWRTARAKMLDHAIALEEKIDSLPSEERRTFGLVLCGGGFRLCSDWLEDFAHFYFSGSYRFDDPFSRMEAYSVDQKKIMIKRTIGYFVHMDRQPLDTSPGRPIKYGPYKNVLLPEFAKDIASDRQIMEAKDILIKAYSPKAIYLFGSYVKNWGEQLPDAESDLDFLVILEQSDEKAYRRSLKGQNALAHFAFPKDVKVYTSLEFDGLAKNPGTLCHKVKIEGRLLYEAP